MGSIRTQLVVMIVACTLSVVGLGGLIYLIGVECTGPGCKCICAQEADD
jgi:hypothetical protein